MGRNYKFLDGTENVLSSATFLGLWKSLKKLEVMQYREHSKGFDTGKLCKLEMEMWQITAEERKKERKKLLINQINYK